MSEIQLELQMLGGLDVRRAGKSIPLPPSKKTRALLAYLGLTRRAHSRDTLCSLLWDVADDPRGALRWSLSKLRKQVDDDQVQRLQTEGERVRLELSGVCVDVLEMRAALSGGKLETAATELLEAWSARCTGEVLEGLDLPDFEVYQAWLVAEREQTRRLHASLLQELVRRHDRAPDRALAYAAAWVRIDPMSPQARLAAMRFAVDDGQVDEAKRQLQAARRLFSELDPAKEAQLVAGWQALRSSAPPAIPAVPSSLRPPSPIEPECAARDSLPSPASRLPLLGRAAELAQLTAAAARVTRTSRAEIALLTGEPGIGKSRLLDELRAAALARGCTVLEGAAFEGETGRPYGPWIDALRKLSPSFSDARRAQLAPLLDGAGTPASSRETLFFAVVEVLTERCVAQAPVLIVLDDVHWLDESSAELLHYAARMQRELPVLFVLAARDAELHDQPNVLRVLRSLRRDLSLTELAIERLDQAAIHALVAGFSGAADAERVFAHSGGNPLFALELVRAGSSAESARTVTEAVRDRIADLSHEAGEVLRWGAVLGAAFAPQLLAAVSSLTAEQRLAGLEQLERHALLRLDLRPDYVFSHEVVRGVVYSDLSQPRRTLMHQRAAEVLARLDEQRGAFDEAVVADIARHAAAGEDHALAARAFVAAGRRCLKLFASENAAAMARKGLRHARELPEPERCRTLLELLDVQLWAKRPADQTEFCNTVSALAETALEHGCTEHARLGFHMLGYVRWERGDWDEARRSMLKAEQAVRAEEGPQHVEALAEVAHCCALLERDLGHAEAILAETKARAKRIGFSSATMLSTEAMLRLHSGEADAADVLFEDARLLARGASQRYVEIQALMNRVQLNIDGARFDRALELAIDTQQLADKTRDGSEVPYARVLIALARLALGGEAVSTLEQALSELRTADAKHRMTYGLSRGAALLNARQNPETAARMATEALEYARLLERPSDIVLALVELGNAQRALGDRTGFVAARDEAVPLGATGISAHARAALAAWEAGVNE